MSFLKEVILPPTIVIIVMYLAIIAPLSRLDVNSDIAGFYAVQATLDWSRENGNEIESAALQLKITEQNAWLAKVKYYNSVLIFELAYPDELDDMEPIE